MLKIEYCDVSKLLELCDCGYIYKLCWLLIFDDDLRDCFFWLKFCDFVKYIWMKLNIEVVFYGVLEFFSFL